MAETRCAVSRCDWALQLSMYVVFLSCAGWVRALPESAAYVWHPAMVGFDSKDLPTWEHILKEGRKVGWGMLGGWMCLTARGDS